MIPVVAAIAVSLLPILTAHQPAASASSTRAETVVPIRACGVLNRPDTTYVLRNDVHAAGTCFAIEADNVTLDLKKHTVTYGAKDSSKPVFGVLAADCWYKAISGNPCGGNHRNVVVMNGGIVQGPAAAPFSHAVRLGQAGNISGAKLHGLNITVSAQDSFAIYGEYLPGGSDIYDNVIHNNVTSVSNRSQFRGASIKLDGESNAKLPDLIHNNVIIGGAQLGIRDDNPAGTRIYENDISQNAIYANGFCIDAAGNNMLIYRNHCHPIHGRGIHANHSGVRIFDNQIETVGSNQIKEYNGCEIQGTYGIQVESDEYNPTNIRVYGNHVTVHAAQCEAEAMRLTDLKGADVWIYDNTFIAVQDKIGSTYSSAAARGFSVGDIQGSHMHFYNNFIQADTSLFYVDWDGGGGLTLNDNTFQAGRIGQATLLADLESGVGPAQNNYFVDDTYRGFSPGSAKFGTYTGDSWYEVLNSVHLEVTDKSGRALHDVSGVAIGTEDKARSQGVTEGPGKMLFYLPALRIENNKPPLSYPAYHITLSAESCNPDAFIASAGKEQTLARQLTCR